MTLKEMDTSIDSMKHTLFPFTLKDKAKYCLNNLKSRTISLRRQINISSFKEGESFPSCWDRFNEAMNASPYHGYDTWQLADFFL